MSRKFYSTDVVDISSVYNLQIYLIKYNLIIPDNQRHNIKIIQYPQNYIVNVIAISSIKRDNVEPKNIFYTARIIVISSIKSCMIFLN